MEKAKILGCGSVLYILQALTTIINFKISNLWLITKGCQSITANSNNNSHKIQLQQTPLWGLGKAITLEHPEYQCRCLDLSPQFNTNDSASILLEEILNCDVENQIAYQQKLRHVARLIQKQRKQQTIVPGICTVGTIFFILIFFPSLHLVVTIVVVATTT